MISRDNLGVSINYCTNDYPFLKATVNQAEKLAKEVIVSTCDHLFDGTPENLRQHWGAAAENPGARFFVFPFIEKSIGSDYLEKKGRANFWHNVGRLVSTKNFSKNIEYILFLDVDEVPDAKAITGYLKQNPGQFNVIKLANYFYFREPRYQAEQFEDSAVIVRRKKLNLKLLLHPGERTTLFDKIRFKKKRMVTTESEEAMIHHYGWVRSRERMIRKVTNWGHKNDRDWPQLVKDEFNREFSGNDFIHGYTYRTVKPFTELDLNATPPEQNEAPANLKTITGDQLLSYLELGKP